MVAVTDGREYRKRENLKLKFKIEMLPIIRKVANCLGNRKDFKDLINLKSILFIARLNSFSLWEQFDEPYRHPMDSIFNLK